METASSNSNPFRTAQDFRARYGISATTLYRWSKRGDVTITFIGRRAFISQEDEAKWLASLKKSEPAVAA